MASKSVNEHQFTIRTSVGYPFGKSKSCKAGDTLLCARDKLPERGDMVLLVRHDGAAMAWRCDCPPFDWHDDRYVFGFEKDNGDVVYFDSSNFADCGVIIDSRGSQA